ncbi:MAG: ATP-binding protein [candidate division WOR-3 bacterium]|nr:MAG: ATP-binding protein [candidate division WOR-3 bacterium]
MIGPPGTGKTMLARRVVTVLPNMTLDDASQSLLKAAIEKFGLSARAYDKVLKVARTIADLENAENIKVEHVAEAIQYRSLDKNVWQRL